MYKFKKLLWIVLLVAGFSVTGLVCGWINGKSIASSEDISLTEDTYDSLRPLIQAMALIKNNYVDAEKTKQKDLVFGAIKGMVTELDPYSQFMDPQGFKDMQEDTKGAFGGLGIEIAIKNDQLTIVSPIEGTPADRAGMKSGDEIIKINGETTEGINIMDAVHKMRGPKGTTCTITIRRRGIADWFDVMIIRDIIQVQSVKYEMLDGNVGYIRLTEFMERTGDGFSKALDDLEGQGMKSLILDLRNNPGGLLNMAAEIAEYFVPQGKMIVYTEGRNPTQNMKFFSSSVRTLHDIPLAVLVNQGSASASEIVAGAIQDWKLGVLVGEKTFGKGSVQTIIPLGDGAALRITTARYLTPKGQMIHGNGITPDLKVEEFRPNEMVIKLMSNRGFEEFAAYYLKLHPTGEVVEKKEDPVKVSESSWKKLKPQTPDDKMKELMIQWFKEKNPEVNMIQLNEDLHFILTKVREEIAKKLKGAKAGNKIRLEGDPQVQAAKDAIKILQLGK